MAANKKVPDSPGADDQTPKRRGREISGPGAADFLAAPGGLDMPENDPAKGTGALRQEGLVDRERLYPNLDEPDPSSEREVLTPNPSQSRPDQKPKR